MPGDRAKTSYTVKQLADLSGVSVRTLHHYDEIDLLKPASVGLNGYRYYGREELLRLQQILFHRELDLSLDEIRQVLDTPDFDRAGALRAHRALLLRKAERSRQLVRTVDETLADLEGRKPMTEKAIYRGFDPETRARQEAWAIERHGEFVRLGIETRDRVMETWTEADHERHRADFAAIFADFAAALAQDSAPGDEPVQAIVRRLHACTSRAWIGPIRRAGLLTLADSFAENPDTRSRLDAIAPGLADYVAKAIRIFVVEETSWPPAAPGDRPPGPA